MLQEANAKLHQIQEKIEKMISEIESKSLTSLTKKGSLGGVDGFFKVKKELQTDFGKVKNELENYKQNLDFMIRSSNSDDKGAKKKPRNDYFWKK